MASSKRHEEVDRLARTGSQADALRARMMVLAGDGGRSYLRGEDLPAGPAAPPPGAPAAPPPPPMSREQWQAEVDRLGRGDQRDQLLARGMVLRGAPPETPAAPAAAPEPPK